VLDDYGETSRAGVFVAGDAAGIGGAKAAQVSGELAGIRIAEQVGRLSSDERLALARPLHRKLRRELAGRPFLDALFKPRADLALAADATIVCRCEGVSAGDIRAAARRSLVGPNQIKAATRAGMGPCQGRQCGYTITRLIADAQRRAPADVGFLHIRPPLKPVTLGELASVKDERS
jgi:NADPH-dependent 2,4-dienoyl-CoA reductase/sulfur reductase-like enzyme